VAPTILALGDREDILLLVTTGGAPIGDIPSTLQPNTIVSHYFNFSQILGDVDVLVAFGSCGTATQALHIARIALISNERASGRLNSSAASSNKDDAVD
jgi:hypothetical protein